MTFHLNSDAVALLALIVSLVALLIAFLQVVQQYAATAYDYRRCSARTMGGWSKHTKRLFVPREIRFETTFAAPHIGIGLHGQKYQIESAQGNFLPDTNSRSTQANWWGPLYERIRNFQQRFELFHRGGQSQSQSSADPETGGIELPFINNEQSSTPWYLSLEGAVPEAACSWLVFLHDTQSVDLWYRISTKRLSVDYLPRDVTRPLATADRGVFLMTLTALGVQWRDRGADGMFVGRSPRSKVEITSTSIPSVGSVYSYNRSPDISLPAKLRVLQPNNRYDSESDDNSTDSEDLILPYLVPSMFNSFQLFGGDITINTWSQVQIRKSLTRMFGGTDSEVVVHFRKCFRPNKLNIGIGELIAGWSDIVAMPRVKGIFGRIECVFSSSSLGCTFGMPELSTILIRTLSGLLNKEESRGPDTETVSQYLDDTDNSIPKFTKMVECYYLYLQSNPDYGENWLKKLYECLKRASDVPKRSNILFYRQPIWNESYQEIYIDLIQERMGRNGLDRELENRRYRHPIETDYRSRPQFRNTAKALLKAYSINNASPVQYSQGDDIESFIHRAILSTAAAAVRARDILSNSNAMNKDSCGDAIINRILRGVLWTIHNRNAPGFDHLAEARHRRRDERAMECSLNHLLLKSNEIVYIS